MKGLPYFRGVNTLFKKFHEVKKVNKGKSRGRGWDRYVPCSMGGKACIPQTPRGEANFACGSSRALPRLCTIATTGIVSAIHDLLQTMARLRGPDGCPWDREQTHQTLCEPLIDETCELLDTIDRGDSEHMCEELGDVLLQVVFHACLAEEKGEFSFDDVARGINEKLVRRHPHVFGDRKLDDAEAVLRQWEQIKAAEKKNGPPNNGLFKRLPPRLPALMFAVKIEKQIQKKGLEPESVKDSVQPGDPVGQLDEASAGEQLYALACACQSAGIDPESALRKYACERVREVEKRHAGV